MQGQGALLSRELNRSTRRAGRIIICFNWLDSQNGKSQRRSERTRTGLARVKAQGRRLGKSLGSKIKGKEEGDKGLLRYKP